MQIAISLDLGRAPSVLAALADQRLAQKAANAAAQSYTEDTLDWIGEGRAFTPRTGQLAQSITWRPLGSGEAEVSASAGYAGFVEEGTGPHIIRPKGDRKALKINIPGGGYILRRLVNHPGSKPYPFFFADRANRGENMRAAARSVLAEALARG